MSERTPSSDVETGPLWTAAMRTAMARQPVAWGAWAALLVVTVGLDLVAHRAGISTAGERLTPAFWTYAVLEGLLGAAVTGVALHALIAGRAPPRLGGGFFAFVGLVTASDLYWTASLYLLVPAQDADPVASLPRAFAMLALLVVGVFAFTRLLLWPMGRLMGDPRVTAAASWRLMRGHVWSYIAASVLIVLPIGVLSLALAAGPMAAAGQQSVLSTLATRVMDTVLTAALAGLSAVMYRRRVGASDAALGQVFD